MSKSIGVCLLLVVLTGCVFASNAPERAFDEVTPEDEVLVETLDGVSSQSLLPQAKKAAKALGSEITQAVESLGKEATAYKVKPSPVIEQQTEEAKTSSKNDVTIPEAKKSAHPKPDMCKHGDTLCKNLMAFKAFLFAGSFNGEFTTGQVGFLQKLIKELQPSEEPIVSGKGTDIGAKVGKDEYDQLHAEAEAACKGVEDSIYCQMAHATFDSLANRGLLYTPTGVNTGHVCLNEKAVGLSEEHAMGEMNFKDALCVTISNFKAMAKDLKVDLLPSPKSFKASKEQIEAWYHTLKAWQGDI